MTNVDRWAFSTPDGDAASYERRATHPLTHDEIRDRVSGAKLVWYESKENLTRVVIVTEGQPTREVSLNGRAFDLNSMMRRSFLGLALCYEMGLTKNVISVAAVLSASALFDELADRAHTGFEVDLQPIAEWAITAEAPDGVLSSEPPNPFAVSIDELLQANRNKSFWGVAEGHSPGVGTVCVEVEGLPSRELRMPRDRDGHELSTGFGWAYSGQGSRALSVALFLELGLGRREALQMLGHTDIAEKLPEGPWRFPATRLVQEVQRARAGVPTQTITGGRGVVI